MKMSKWLDMMDDDKQEEKEKERDEKLKQMPKKKPHINKGCTNPITLDSDHIKRA